MKEAKRLEKENNIIEAAQEVFLLTGFKNTKMEDIAGKAGITKVTLYTYFQSKENLYMALTFKALNELINTYQITIEKTQDQKGIESAVNLLNSFMVFGEENPLYSELLLEYFQIVRTSVTGQSKEQRLTAALNDSSYFKELQKIHNRPFKMAFKEVQRGQEDGSIKNDIDPMLATLQAWTMGLGYTKVMSNSGGDAIFNIELGELRKNLVDNLRIFLAS